MDKLTSPPPETATPRSTWLDLFLYLVCGFGLFIAAGVALRGVISFGTLVASLVIYALNVFFFIGTVWVIGVLRGKLSWRELGFYPPRWNWNWLWLAGVIVLFFYPIRIALALAVQFIVEGNLNSLMNNARAELLVPSGFTWPSFLVTLVMVGLAAPVSEELFFRGAIYTWFRQHFSLWPAVLASSFLFALGHIDTLAVVITSFILGAVNALLYERFRSIWVPIAVHAVNNSIAVILVYASVGITSLIK